MVHNKMAQSRPNVNNEDFDRYRIEQFILKLGDEYEIRVLWDKTTAILTGTFALAGGLVGGYAYGWLGTAIGVGVGGVAGFALASLRETWSHIRKKLNDLIYIVFNYLRRIDPVDYVRAIDILETCIASRRELVRIILDFLAEKLKRLVVSSLTAANSHLCANCADKGTKTKGAPRRSQFRSMSFGKKRPHQPTD